MRLVEAYGELLESIPAKMTAYHCGAKLKGGKFSLAYLGQGEGLAALGPGIYFATDEGVARGYCKYAADAMLYTVEIPTKGLFRVGSLQADPSLKPFWVWLKAERQKLIDQGHGIEKFGGRMELPSGSRTKDGPDFIGSVIKIMGKEAGRRHLLKLGITGAIERLPQGYEIAVYDPKLIKIVSKEKV